MADETTSKRPTSVVTAKKAAAKKATAKKLTAKKMAANTSTAKKAAAKQTTAKLSIAGAAPVNATSGATQPSAAAEGSPESTYVMAAIDAASELSVQWESAGHELVGRIQDIKAQPMPTIPGDVIDALGAAAESNDVAGYLSAHQSLADAVESSAKRVTVQYNAALSDYQARLESTVRANQAKNAKLFADYVKAVKNQLTADIDDPVKIYQLGWSLMAASQIAAAGQGA
jgi:hypothetical protein